MLPRAIPHRLSLMNHPRVSSSLQKKWNTQRGPSWHDCSGATYTPRNSRRASSHPADPPKITIRMSHSAEIESLAAELHRNAIAISLYCDQSNIPHKSLKSVTPATLIPDDAPASLQAAKEGIKEAALRLTQLASDPREFLNSFQVEVSFAKQAAC